MWFSIVFQDILGAAAAAAAVSGRAAAASSISAGADTSPASCVTWTPSNLAQLLSAFTTWWKVHLQFQSLSNNNTGGGAVLLVSFCLLW